MVILLLFIEIKFLLNADSSVIFVSMLQYVYIKSFACKDRIRICGIDQLLAGLVLHSII